MESTLIITCSDRCYIAFNDPSAVVDDETKYPDIKLNAGTNIIQSDVFPTLKYGFKCKNGGNFRITSIDLSLFSSRYITDMSWMFSDCSSLKTIDLNNLDTSNVTDMCGMFDCCDNLREIDLSNFNTSKVINMSGMFMECYWLTHLDLSNFDTSCLKTVRSMFDNCCRLETINISGWDLSRDVDTSWMFDDCSSLTKIIAKDCNNETIEKIKYELNEVDINNVSIIV